MGFERGMGSSGESFKVIIWGGNASHKDGQFLWKMGFSLCNTSASKPVVSLTGYCKFFYRIPLLFSILLLFYLFCIYQNWQGQKFHWKCPKVYDMTLTLSYKVMVISTCTHILMIQTPLPTLSQEYIYCNWKSTISELSFFEIKKFSI